MSAASFHLNLRAAVRTKLNTLAGLPPVAWEGKDFTPVKGQPFVSESVAPVSSVVMAAGEGGYIAHTVMANFTLHYPPNRGTVDIDTLAGGILQLFKPGTAISYGGATAVVLQVERAGLRQDPDWLNLTVSATLVGHTSN